jgi:hypothetical protein
MDAGQIGALAGVVGAFFGGLIMLTPVVALSLRFAMKPMVEGIARLKSMPAADGGAKDLRIQMLEAEVAQLNAAVQQLAEADDFRRQLAGPAAGRREPVGV